MRRRPERKRRGAAGRGFAAVALLVVAAGTGGLAATSCTPATVAPTNADAGGDALGVEAAARDAASDAPVEANVDAPTDAPDAGAQDADVDVCDRYAYAYCLQYQTCSGAGLALRYGTVATCQILQRLQCLAELEAPATAETIELRQGCLSALPSWDCPSLLYTENVPPACATVAGSLPNGTPCSVSQQCASAFCGLEEGQACGTCIPKPVVGSSCAVYSCSIGLTCFTASQTCGLHSAPNTACGGGTTNGASCDIGATCLDDVCQLTATSLGAPCTPSVGCDSFDGLACNGVSGKCAPAYLAQPGQACGEVDDQEQTCVAGTCTRGVCVGAVALGGACVVGGPACLPTLRCVAPGDAGTGTCQPYYAQACP